MTVPDERFTEPLLTIPETGRHLVIAEGTVRRWADRSAGRPLIHVVEPRKDHATVPFMAAVETQILRGLRMLGLPLEEIRLSVKRLRSEFGQWALVQNELAVEGKNLLVNMAEKASSAAWERARDGQIGIPEVIDEHLQYLDFDTDGFAARLTLRSYKEQGADVILDPRFGYGEPVFAASKVKVRDITDAFYAGEDPQDVAYDYDIDISDVFAALRVLGPRRVA